MPDAPLPPQTDYPYAARVHIGPVLEEPPPPTPASGFARLAERLDIFFDWHSPEQVIAERDFPTIQEFVAGVCAFAVINVLPLVAIELLDGSPPEWLAILILAPLLGIIAGEFVVFAVALVWWRGNFILRLAAHWLVALFLYCCWAMGFAAFNSLENRSTQSTLDESWMVLAAIPAISIAVQAPLWCLRIYGGWRLAGAQDYAAAAPTAQVSIRDVLAGTTIVAASVAMLRVTFDKPEKFGDAFWIAWGIAFPSVVAISLFTVAPLMRLILGTRSWGMAVLAIFGYWLLIAGIITGVFLYFNPGGEGKGMALALSLMTLTGFVTVSIPLWLARATGYRLCMSK